MLFRKETLVANDQFFFEELADPVPRAVFAEGGQVYQWRL